MFVSMTWGGFHSSFRTAACCLPPWTPRPLRGGTVLCDAKARCAQQTVFAKAFSIDYTNMEFEKLCSSCGRNQEWRGWCFWIYKVTTLVVWICIVGRGYWLSYSTQAHSHAHWQDGRLTFADVQQAQHQVSKRVEDLWVSNGTIIGTKLGPFLVNSLTMHFPKILGSLFCPPLTLEMLFEMISCWHEEMGDVIPGCYIFVAFPWCLSCNCTLFHDVSFTLLAFFAFAYVPCLSAPPHWGRPFWSLAAWRACSLSYVFFLRFISLLSYAFHGISICQILCLSTSLWSMQASPTYFNLIADLRVAFLHGCSDNSFLSLLVVPCNPIQSFPILQFKKLKHLVNRIEKTNPSNDLRSIPRSDGWWSHSLTDCQLQGLDIYGQLL